MTIYEQLKKAAGMADVIEAAECGYVALDNKSIRHLNNQLMDMILRRNSLTKPHRKENGASRELYTVEAPKDKDGMSNVQDCETVKELIRLANTKNISVKFKPLKYNDGRLKGNQILIREGMDEDHTIWILAHEIAHWFLHYDKGNTMTSPLHDEYEEQADRGAKMLLCALSQ